MQTPPEAYRTPCDTGARSHSDIMDCDSKRFDLSCKPSAARKRQHRGLESVTIDPRQQLQQHHLRATKLQIGRYEHDLFHVRLPKGNTETRYRLRVTAQSGIAL